MPVELTGSSAFPPVGELPYMLTLPAYGFYWFILATEAEEPRWHVAQPEAAPDFVTLIASDGWRVVFADPQKRTLERDVLPYYMLRQRWFGAKDAPFILFELHHIATLQGAHGSHPLTICEASMPGGEFRSTSCRFA